MSEVGAPLARLYLFCAACAFFATAYGLALLEPAPPMTFMLLWGPAIAVAVWLTADS